MKCYFEFSKLKRHFKKKIHMIFSISSNITNSIMIVNNNLLFWLLHIVHLIEKGRTEYNTMCLDWLSENNNNNNAINQTDQNNKPHCTWVSHRDERKYLADIYIRKLLTFNNIFNMASSTRATYTHSSELTLIPQQNHYSLWAKHISFHFLQGKCDIW